MWLTLVFFFILHLFRTHSFSMKHREYQEQRVKRGYTDTILSKAWATLWFQDLTKTSTGPCMHIKSHMAYIYNRKIVLNAFLLKLLAFEGPWPRKTSSQKYCFSQLNFKWLLNLYWVYSASIYAGKLKRFGLFQSSQGFNWNTLKILDLVTLPIIKSIHQWQKRSLILFIVLCFLLYNSLYYFSFLNIHA